MFTTTELVFKLIWVSFILFSTVLMVAGMSKVVHNLTGSKSRRKGWILTGIGYVLFFVTLLSLRALESSGLLIIK